MPVPLPQLETRRFSADIARQHLGEIYAHALIRAADGNGTTEAVLRQLGEFVRGVFDKVPGLPAVLGSPRISSPEKIALLERAVNSTAMPEFTQFIRVVARHERLDCLREIYLAARQIWNKKNGVVEVEVTSAAPLDQKLLRQVEDALRTKLGSEVELELHTDPTLIGGLKIRVGDEVMDGSVAARLETLGKQTAENAVRSIRSQTDRFATGSA
jgi:F-type H+-transporting ATPase subunit delta